jgi:hypothetical protein
VSKERREYRRGEGGGRGKRGGSRGEAAGGEALYLSVSRDTCTFQSQSFWLISRELMNCRENKSKVIRYMKKLKKI